MIQARTTLSQSPTQAEAMIFRKLPAPTAMTTKGPARMQGAASHRHQTRSLYCNSVIYDGHTPTLTKRG